MFRPLKKWPKTTPRLPIYSSGPTTTTLARDDDVWLLYKREATAYDATRFHEWESHMDTILIVSSLYTGVSTAILLAADAHADDGAALISVALTHLATGDHTPINTPKPDFWWSATGYLFRFCVFGYCTVTVMAFLVKVWLVAYKETINDFDPKGWSCRRHKRYEGTNTWHFTAVIRFTEATLITTCISLAIAGAVAIVAIKSLWQLHLLALPGLPALIFIFAIFFHEGFSESFPYKSSPFRRLPRTKETGQLKRVPGVEQRALLWLLALAPNETTIRAVITWFRRNNTVADLEAFIECLEEVSRRVPLQLACAAGPLMELFDLPLPDKLVDKVQSILISVSKRQDGAAHVLLAILNRFVVTMALKPFPFPHTVSANAIRDAIEVGDMDATAAINTVDWDFLRVNPKVVIPDPNNFIKWLIDIAEKASQCNADAIFIRASSLVLQCTAPQSMAPRSDLEQFSKSLHSWFSGDDRGKEFAAFYRVVAQHCGQPATDTRTPTSTNSASVREHLFGSRNEIKREDAFSNLCKMAW